MSPTSRTSRPISLASMRDPRCSAPGQLNARNREQGLAALVVQPGQLVPTSVVSMKGAREIVERMTGWSRPEAARLSTLVRERQANEFRFADDGFIPNH